MCVEIQILILTSIFDIQYKFDVKNIEFLWKHCINNWIFKNKSVKRRVKYYISETQSQILGLSGSLSINLVENFLGNWSKMYTYCGHFKYIFTHCKNWSWTKTGESILLHIFLILLLKHHQVTKATGSLKFCRKSTASALVAVSCLAWIFVVSPATALRYCIVCCVESR